MTGTSVNTEPGVSAASAALGDPGAAPAITPTARATVKRLRGWIIAVVGLLVASVITLLGAGAMNLSSTIELDPTSPTPEGGRALYQVLGQHGIATTLANSRADVDAALAKAGPTTLVVDDPARVLSDDQYLDLARAAGDANVSRIVLLHPTGTARRLADEVANYVGVFSAPTSEPQPSEPQPSRPPVPTSYAAGDACPFAAQAPEISNLGGTEYEPRADGVGCYPVRDGFGIVIGNYEGVEVAVVGVPRNFTNDRILEAANAAAALNLLGTAPNLVWYVAGSADVLSDAPALNDYVPSWLTPVLVLLLLVGIMAIQWRGVRFGPLVAERLPVTVPAAETAQGRANLYEQAGARLRALDSIRIGTVSRLAKLLGLGSTAAVEEIADATAATAQVSREHAWRVLLGEAPNNDAELVDLANAAAELEQRVRAVLGMTATDTSANRDPRTNDPGADKPSTGKHNPTESRTPYSRKARP